MTLALTIADCDFVKMGQKKVSALIAKYNMNMRGVDKIDQHISRYANSNKEYKCWISFDRNIDLQFSYIIRENYGKTISRKFTQGL